MRLLLLLLIAVVLGIVLGVTSTWRHFVGVQERFDLDARVKQAQIRNAKAKEPLPPTAGAMVEVVNGADYDFGEMERFSKRSHKFILKNPGTAPLKLENGGTSCSACTIIGTVKNELQPGETTEVLVEWTASSSEPEFRKEAYVRTTDAANPKLRLTIHGRVSQLVVVEPRELTLGRLSQSSPARGTVQIFSYAANEFEFGEPTLANSQIAEFFDVQVTPLDATALAKKPGAKQGISIAVTVQPGLPLGAFAQTIRMSTTLAAVPKVEINVHGIVGGDISIAWGAGGRYEEKDGVLTLGLVDRKKGSETTLQLIVKGPHRQDVQFEVASIEPADVLTAKLGETKSINHGAVFTIPLKVEIPPNSVVTSRMGGKDTNDYGKIILRTTHPTVKEVKILVRFAIEG